MVYGDGFAAADDVVGHELTHGVTEFSSHLFYYFQSGAINESLSDVFGEFVDLTNGAGNDTAGVKWQLGEDLPSSIGAIRNMKTRRNPTRPCRRADPDRMTSPNYTIDQNEGDDGGVHTNSGVNNKAAYLITDGTAGEPGGTFNGRTITGLGITKAARIYYEVETAFLTSGSDYADLGSALPQACDNLVGTVGITAADCTQVRGAVAATRDGHGPAERRRAPEAPRRGLRRQPGAPEPLLRQHGERLPAGANWYYPTTSASGTSTQLRPQRRLRPARRRLRGPAGMPLVSSWTGTSRSRPARRRSCASTTPTASRTSARPASSTAACSSSAPTAARRGRTSAPCRTDGRLQRHHHHGTGNPLGGRAAFVSESNGYRATRANADLPGGPERALPLPDRNRRSTVARAAAGSSTTSASTRVCRTPTATASRTTPTPARPSRGDAERLPAGHAVAAAGRPRRRAAAAEARHRGDAQEREAAAPARSAARARSCAPEVHAQQVRRRPPRDGHHQEGQEDGAQEVAASRPRRACSRSSRSAS